MDTKAEPVGVKRKVLNQGLPRDQKEVLQSYPKELTQQFQPLFCALCDAKLTSNTTALMHYNSKNHKKKVNNYLEQWSKKTGEPMPKKLCLDKTNDTERLHCDACDLPLTSKQHAQQHYMGKPHQMVIQQKRNPTGSGFYQDGKWIRLDTQKSDPTGRFGIGRGFLQKPEDASNTSTVTPKPSDSTSTPKPTDSTSIPKPAELNRNLTKEDLYCAVCQVTVTSAPQMIAHKNGLKHRKRLSKKEGLYTERLPETVPIYSPDYIPSINGESLIDVSNYRTPTGSFYCRPCDVAVVNEQQFRAHIGSKKHSKKKNVTVKNTQ